MITYLIISVLAGYLVGLFAGHYFFTPKKKDMAGTLKFRTDDVDGETYLFLELMRPPEALLKMKTVQFEIDPNARK